jgi:hypothetical protein
VKLRETVKFNARRGAGKGYIRLTPVKFQEGWMNCAQTREARQGAEVFFLSTAMREDGEKGEAKGDGGIEV